MLIASELIKIRPFERDKYFNYPYTGPYTGKPTLYEIQHLKEQLETWGVGRVGRDIHKVCPSCGSKKAEWLRNEWAVCYDCLLAFDI